MDSQSRLYVCEMTHRVRFESNELILGVRRIRKEQRNTFEMVADML